MSGCDSCKEDQRVMRIQKKCAGCRHHVEPPERIMLENLVAYRVFLYCHRQWLVGFNGAYALDGNFVWKVLDDMGIQSKREIFSRVDNLAAHYLKAVKKK